MSENNTTGGGEQRHLRIYQALLVVGGATFAVALITGQSQRAWQAYLLNFVLWTGIAQAGVAFSAAYRVSKGQWSDTYRRLGESLGFFLPLSLVLFVFMMLFGGSSLFSWVAHPPEGKEVWLNLPFVTVRDLFVLSAVAGLSAAYVYYSQRTALHEARVGGNLADSGLISRWTAGAGTPEDQARSEHRATFLAPLLLIAFGVGYSLIGFDLVMSLDPHWYSTLFGWYFFVGAFYAMLAVLAIAGVVFRKVWKLEHHLSADQSHDLGRLLFGFCLLTGGFFWAQWLVFWYGNLPEEIGYVIHRFYAMPFAPYAWTMTYGAFVVPLVVLLSRSIKRRPRRLMTIAFWVLLMMWLERYVWIVPSTWSGEGAPFVIEALVTLGFLGAFGWGWISHNRRLPVAAIAQPQSQAAHHSN